METVYIVGIVAVAAVLLGVVWVLRGRIASGRFWASAEKKEVEAEFQATPENASAGTKRKRVGKPPAVDISKNKMAGANKVRVVRDNVRVNENRLRGKNVIEVENKSPEPASKSKKAKRKKM